MSRGNSSETRPAKTAVGRILWTALGLVCIGLGSAGIVLPILPTVPFFMAAAFCLAKGSERLDRWFKGSSLYEKHLKPFKESRSLALKSKLKIVATVTLLLSISFILMDGVIVGRACILVVWVAHLLYFGFHIRTAPSE